MWFDSFIRNANVEMINPLQKKTIRKTKPDYKKKETKKKRETFAWGLYYFVRDMFWIFRKAKKKINKLWKRKQKKRNHPSLSPKKRRRTENGSRAIKAAKLSLVCSSFSWKKKSLTGPSKKNEKTAEAYVIELIVGSSFKYQFDYWLYSWLEWKTSQ